MGTTQTKSVEGLKLCPYGFIFHIHTDHSDEITECDHCGEVKTCNVSCEAPKSAVLHRTCRDCVKSKEDNLAEIANVMGWDILDKKSA